MKLFLHFLFSALKNEVIVTLILFFFAEATFCQTFWSSNICQKSKKIRGSSFPFEESTEYKNVAFSQVLSKGEIMYIFPTALMSNIPYALDEMLVFWSEFSLYEFIPVGVHVFCTLHFGDLWPPPSVSNQIVRK